MGLEFNVTVRSWRSRKNKSTPQYRQVPDATLMQK